jgi:uncharacterized repeat protein (TIGR01451 family)
MKAAMALLVSCFAVISAAAQVIDFETLPDGSPTQDLQEISTQYSEVGVTFSIIDQVTGEFVGYPRVAKVGLPATAFRGCSEWDEPLPGYGVGSSFLTDDDDVSSVAGDLLITYENPVFRASGVVLDVDCREGGGPPCEQWTVTALDSSGLTIATQIINGPPGAENPECLDPDAGPGDGVAFAWAFDVAPQTIHAIRMHYTGEAPGVGLAFDNFSPASVETDLSVVKSGPTYGVEIGDELAYSVTVRNDGPGDATGVTLLDQLPPGVVFASAVSSQGTCYSDGRTISCELGAVSVGDSVVVDITGVLLETVLLNRATVSSNEYDLFPGGNADTVLTTVLCAGSSVHDSANDEAKTRLRQNSPNPFGPDTELAFYLPSAGHVDLSIFTIAGRHVATLVDKGLEAGPHAISWNGTDSSGVKVASGVYFYRLTVDGVRIGQRKVILIK